MTFCCYEIKRLSDITLGIVVRNIKSILARKNTIINPWNNKIHTISCVSLYKRKHKKVIYQNVFTF